ncbi:uncharacterized protein LOC116306023 isoform X2 [Actinia tenebrosa]|uniref:Uncharacterized protein LOC116306023 isoform X2 n=1 Tax=Actinia tenebrosa TaxID=6105 RepID=A0A6P8IWZ4_ACTTE|nr:uncharacterized protein LOC116306023 isoform X2 [Actinia tenebrosa]
MLEHKNYRSIKSGSGAFTRRAMHHFSLADIYEGALRKVLNLQLNLKIEEHPRFHDLTHDVTYKDKTSPPRPRAIRIEDANQREEYRHPRRANENENDPRVTPQGHNVLRKVGERSPAEGSAFHVPSKRRYDGHNFTSMEREQDLPVDRFGVPSRHVGPDYPGEYSPSHYHPHLYGPRMNQIGGPRLGHSFMEPRNVVRETYSRYSSHHREIPPLFPVHCSTSDRDGLTTARSTELEGRELRCPDLSRINGLHLKYTNSKMPIAKFEQEEKENLEETFNRASKSLSIHTSTSPSSPGCKSPRADHVQPYGRHTRPNSNTATNGVEDKNNDKPNGEIDKEKKQSNGEEEGEKEEFLSSLGLAKIF